MERKELKLNADEKEWCRIEALRLTAKEQKPVSANEVIRRLIQNAMQEHAIRKEVEAEFSKVVTEDGEASVSFVLDASEIHLFPVSKGMTAQEVMEAAEELYEGQSPHFGSNIEIFDPYKMIVSAPGMELEVEF